MDVLVVCVGQCGLTLGARLMQILPAREHRRYVFVDSEPGVAGALRLGAGDASAYLSVVTGKHGRGNNFAFGYSDSPRDPLLERSADAIRKACEAMGYVEAVLFIRSVAGGTGAGFGCRLMSAVRGQLGAAVFIADVQVAPFATGETPLQHINAALVHAHSARLADVIFTLSNDRATRANASSAHVSLADINLSLSRTLGLLLMPVQAPGAGADAAGPSLAASGADDVGRPLRVAELVVGLAPQARLRCVQLYAAPLRGRRDGSQASRPAAWPELGRSLCAAMPSFEYSGARPRRVQSTAQLIVTRSMPGEDAALLGSDRAAVLALLADTAPVVAWQPFGVDVICSGATGLPASWHVPRALVLATNSTAVLEPMQRTLDRAAVMYESHAFLHWYARHGVDDEAIGEALLAVQDACDAYGSLYDDSGIAV